MNEIERAKSLFTQGLESYRSRDYLTAERFFLEALNYVPDRISILINLCSAQIKLGKLDLARAAINKVLERDKNASDAWLNLGFISKEEGDLYGGIEAFTKAIEINPSNFEAYLNRGIACRDLGQYSKALKDFEKCIELEPNSGVGHYHTGLAYQDNKNYKNALLFYMEALRLNSSLECLIGNIMFCKQNIFDWSDSSWLYEKINLELAKGNNPIYPFTLLGCSNSLQLQFMVAKSWAESNFPKQDRRLGLREQSRDISKKIKVAYISGDFSQHAVGLLTSGLYKRHNRKKFHVLGLSTVPLNGDWCQKKIASDCDFFLDVSKYSDLQIEDLCQKLDIDIAVDLSGYTKGGRTQIFSRRIAPIQINYLGYPGTMGSSCYDYIIADKALISPGEEKYYSEKIIYMPFSYQINDQDRKVYRSKKSKPYWGLPENNFVYCCFNNGYKMNKNFFEIWMRILKAVPDSVLWLLKDNKYVVEKLKDAAEKNGVSSERIIFAERVGADDHMERHIFADIFLDTLPYNAHTTGSDALWMGLPLLTARGESFAGRVGASLLSAIGMPELIANNLEEYEKIAIDLGRSPQKLLAIKDKLTKNKNIFSLFNTDKFVWDLEFAFEEAYSRLCDKLSPDHIFIDSHVKKNT